MSDDEGTYQAHDILFDKQSSKGSLSPVLCNRVCLDLEIVIIITNCSHTRVLLMFLYDADLIKAAVVEDNTGGDDRTMVLIQYCTIVM